MTDSGFADLWDYRRRVAQIYSDVRSSGASEATWRQWCAARDELFRDHPQSPVAQDRREQFDGLPYVDYDQAWSLSAELHEVDPEPVGLVNSSEGETPMVHFADVHVESPAGPFSLGVFWIDVYGGGVFIPFRDVSNGVTTYGGGRYLLDTAKSADLGNRDGEVVLDFNFAYHPSCTHNPGWSCPLAPPSNRLNHDVPVGERSP